MKSFEYWKSYVATNGFFFLQETHLSIGDEEKWKGKFNGKLFFSHGETDSCRVLIGYCGIQEQAVINEKCGNSGRILLIERNIDDSLFADEYL